MSKRTNNECSCVSCHVVLTVNNLKTHYGSKRCISGYTKYPEPNKCIYCGSKFENENKKYIANHVRWCENNPKHDEYISNASQNAKIINNIYQNLRDLSKMPQKISNLHKSGHYDNAYKQSIKTKISNGKLYPSEETKMKMSISCSKSKHRRCSKRTKNFTDQKGRTFNFDSSWEVALAIRLDELNINWIRPDPIEYEIDGRTRNYFGDFYLTDYDVYLDPKNPWVRSMQEKKIEILSNQINLIILGTLQECEKFTL